MGVPAARIEQSEGLLIVLVPVLLLMKGFPSPAVKAWSPLRYGWTADRVAVIPRLTAAVNCGKGKTGVVPWAASEDQKFGVFCFNASGAARP